MIEIAGLAAGMKLEGLDQCIIRSNIVEDTLDGIVMRVCGDSMLLDNHIAIVNQFYGADPTYPYIKLLNNRGLYVSRNMCRYDVNQLSSWRPDYSIEYSDNVELVIVGNDLRRSYAVAPLKDNGGNSYVQLMYPNNTNWGDNFTDDAPTPGYPGLEGRPPVITVLETETARPISIKSPIKVVVGKASETDTSNTVTPA
jgi:hypothetical protein